MPRWIVPPYDWSLRAPMRALRWVLQEALLFPAVRLFGPPRVEGRELAAALDGPAVIVSNHRSHFDAPALLFALPPGLRRRTLVAAAQDYFFMRGPGLAAAVSLVLGAIPFDRAPHSPKGVARSVKAIRGGWSILIFPEGTRGEGGMAAFRGGAGRLCIACGVPAVPARLPGTSEVLPRGARFPRAARVTVRFGAPVLPRPGEDERTFTRRLEEAVRSLEVHGAG